MLGIDQNERQSQPLSEIPPSVFLSFLDRNLYKKTVDGSSFSGRGDQTTRVDPEQPTKQHASSKKALLMEKSDLAARLDLLPVGDLRYVCLHILRGFQQQLRVLVCHSLIESSKL